MEGTSDRSMQQSAIRVHLIGNTCNNHYNIAKHLRRLGVDAHLFYDTRLSFQTMPEADDEEILRHRPAWLHPYGREETGPTPYLGVSPTFMDSLSACDILHVEDVGLVWAWRSGVPTVWDPYGWDLNHYAFFSYWLQHGNEQNPEHFIVPILYRRAIASASAIVWALWYKDVAHGYRLINEIAPDRFRHAPPVGIDAEMFSPGPRVPIQELCAARGIAFTPGSLTIFSPSRVMFTPASYVSKGTDRLIRAVAEVNAEGGDVSLILVRRGNPDEQAARDIIEQSGIAGRVVWVDEMPRRELVDWYRSADLVVDALVGGDLGGVAYESMACGTALMTHFVTSSAESTYWPPTEAFPSLPPLLSVSETPEVASALRQALRNPAMLRELGSQGRDWILRTNSGPAVASAWIEVYREVLAAPPAARVTRIAPSAASERNALTAVREVRKAIASGDLSSAVRQYAKVLDESPEDPRLHEGFFQLLERLGRRNLAEAIRPHLRNALGH